MSVAQRSAVHWVWTPSTVRGVEKPKPGREGAITSKESAGSPPKAAGSVSLRVASFQSQKLQGQPWVRMMGSGFGPFPRS